MSEPGDIRVIVAIDPPSYGSAIGTTIQLMRPHITTEIVAPHDLGRAIERLDPALVLCSQHAPATPDPGPHWVEYRPYTDPTALRINGRRHDLSRTVELADLIATIDDAEALRQRSG